MLRNGLIALGIGVAAILLLATNAVGFGPCTIDTPGALALLAVFTCIPLGLLLVSLAGARTLWLWKRQQQRRPRPQATS